MATADEQPPRARVARLLDGLHARLQRQTTSLEYMPEIDGLRFLAIGTVLLHHLSGYLTSSMPTPPTDSAQLRALLATGNIGVQIFFAISGFVLALPFLKARLGGARPVRLSDYFLRRLTRLEPPYLFSLIILFALKFRSLEQPWQHLGFSAVYLHNFVYGTGSTINFVAWSLEIEVQFYILMPLIAWVFFRGSAPWPRRVALMLLCLLLTWRQAVLYGAHFPHGLDVLDQAQYFAVGVILADVYLLEWKGRLDTDSPTRRAAFDSLALFSWVALPAAILIDREHARFVVAPIIWLACVGTLRGGVFRTLVRNRWISAIGGMCYTMYLYHWYVLGPTLKVLGGATAPTFLENLLTRGSVIVAAVTVVSAVLFILVEKPFMGIRLKRRSPPT